MSILFCDETVTASSRKRRRCLEETLEEVTVFEFRRMAVEQSEQVALTEKILDATSTACTAGKKLHVCVNVANPFARCAAINDMSALIFGTTQRVGIRTTGVLAMLFNNCSAECLGKGTTGTIYSVAFSGERVALKTNFFDLSRRALQREAAQPRCTSKLFASEPRIAAFLTRHILRVDNPTLARCPNFAALYAYEFTNAYPRAADKQMHLSRLWRDYACVSVSEVFNAGNGERCHSGSPFETEKSAFSFVAQALIALSTLAMLGIAHNDTAHRNFVAHKVPAEQLVYEFPAESAGNSTLISVKTNGLLWALIDFGLASQTQFERTGDYRFPDNYDIAKRHGYLQRYYYPDRAPRACTNLLMFDGNNYLIHALETELTDFERDVAFFLSESIAKTDNNTASARVNSYLRATLAEYCVARELQSSQMFMQITQRVLSLAFTSRFFGTETANEFYGTDIEPYTHIYRLPTELDSLMMTRDLEQLLDSDVVLHSIVRVVAEAAHADEE